MGIKNGEVRDMISRFQVAVGFDDFAEAASLVPKLRRAPRGAKGLIPTDTLLSADPEGIVVETAAVSSLVKADKAWMFNASVDSRRLLEVCKTLKSLGANGETIKVDIQERQLWLTFRTTKICIPTLWVR